MQKIVLQRLKAVETLKDEDFEKADQMERDLIVEIPVHSFGDNTLNIVIEADREFSKLCAALEMEGISVDGKTVLQFEGAIETIVARAKKARSAQRNKIN